MKKIQKWIKEKTIEGHQRSFWVISTWLKTTFFDILKYFLMFRIFHVRMYDGNKAYHPSDRRIINREVAIKIRFDLIRPHCFDFDQITWLFRNHFFPIITFISFLFRKSHILLTNDLIRNLTWIWPEQFQIWPWFSQWPRDCISLFMNIKRRSLNGMAIKFLSQHAILDSSLHVSELQLKFRATSKNTF